MPCFLVTGIYFRLSGCSENAEKAKEVGFNFEFKINEL
jgi:hypothetical protein